MDNTLLAAKIVKTHGIRGEVKAFCYTDSPLFFKDIKNVVLEPGELSLKLSSSRPHKDAVLLTFSGIDSIEKAEKIVGKEVYVSRDEISLPEGRFYIADIIGLSVITDEGETVGEVIDVFPAGGSDVFEVKRENMKNAYIPNIADIVKNIDTEKKTVIIHVIKGLLDDED